MSSSWGRGPTGSDGPVPVPHRELHAEIVVDAPPERVWAAVTDIERMPERSPELVRMVPLRRGGLRVGQSYLGVNRRGPVVWPTRSVVREVESPRVLVWDTRTSGARWIYRVEPAEGGGTRLSLTRPVLGRIPLPARAFAALLLGGTGPHSDELEDGMRTTLRRIAADVTDVAG